MAVRSSRVAQNKGSSLKDVPVKEKKDSYAALHRQTVVDSWFVCTVLTNYQSKTHLLAINFCRMFLNKFYDSS